MSRPDTIIISPIGDIPEWIFDAISKKVETLFGFKIKVLSLLDNIDFALDENRRQYYSTQILDRLEKKAPRECVKVLAVTEEDLFIPILTHVYGEAQLGGKSSIVSISRLVSYSEDTPMKISRSRVIKEAAHELGHTFDLKHCDDEQCIMHYCRKIEDVDDKSDRFCRYCTIFLADHIKWLEE